MKKSVQHVQSPRHSTKSSGPSGLKKQDSDCRRGSQSFHCCHVSSSLRHGKCYNSDTTDDSLNTISLSSHKKNESQSKLSKYHSGPCRKRQTSSRSNHNGKPLVPNDSSQTLQLINNDKGQNHVIDPSTHDEDLSKNTMKAQHILATKEICAWCFSLICHALGNFDLLPSNHYSTHSSCNETENNCNYVNNDVLTPSPYINSKTPRMSSLPQPPETIKMHSRNGINVAVFVSWMIDHHSIKHQSSQSSLRGCIGSLEPIPIQDISRYCYRAAFEDTRFKPISAKELPYLECHVSFLHSFEICQNPYDWDIDTHGIIINFHHTNNSQQTYQATFLPGIAKEHQMTYKTTLTELIVKAGWHFAVDDHFISRLHVVRYQSSKQKLKFSEYIKEFLGKDEWII